MIPVDVDFFCQIYVTKKKFYFEVATITNLAEDIFLTLKNYHFLPNIKITNSQYREERTTDIL